MNKRLTIEITDEKDKQILLKFKSKCAGSGESMKEVLIKLISKFLE